MVNRVIQKVEYNMILGSADGSNGFFGLKGATDGWTPQLEYTDLFEGITDAVAECSISDQITIVMNPKTFAELRKTKGTDGHSRFNELATKEQIAQSFGAVRLETRVWVRGHADLVDHCRDLALKRLRLVLALLTLVDRAAHLV